MPLSTPLSVLFVNLGEYLSVERGLFILQVYLYQYIEETDKVVERLYVLLVGFIANVGFC
jgi:hypothetical protein